MVRIQPEQASNEKAPAQQGLCSPTTLSVVDRGMDKSYILKEIARTAEDNGGIALGRKRFLEATGIKESDWLGKYWAKWSDAVREAGYVPDQMRTGFADEYVLEKYAELVEELGHIPTSAELRMKCRTTPDFPSHNTFSRFGSKQHLINRLHAFCAEISDRETAAEICSPHIKPIEKKEAADLDQSDSFGHVYLIKSGRFYKIGRTKSVSRRERELAIQLPEPAETIHTIATDDAPGIEAYWHQRFASRRKNGEWFELSAIDVKAFRRRKFM